MKVPIRVESVEELPDGSVKLNIEYDDETKALLMKAWGLTEWDEEVAQREFIKAIREGLKEKSNAQEG
jgi:hypothetical protein